MKKLKMIPNQKLIFEKGCNKYLEYCRQRNLRDDSIRHYKQSFLYFYKYFDKNMPIEDIDVNTYKDYVLHLKSIIYKKIPVHIAREWIFCIALFLNFV